jgi:hypothetical protein
VVRVSRRFQYRRWLRRRLLLPDLGATRHLLLIGLVGLCILAGLHWQGRVNCLLQSVAFNVKYQIDTSISC